MSRARDRKEKYLKRAKELLSTYTTILVVTADNVTAAQLAGIRKNLRGEAIILMGKNTLMRKAVRDVVAADESKGVLNNLLPKIEGNCGLVFTEKPIAEIRGKLEAEKKQAGAKAGAIAPVSVTIPAGPTPLGPQDTAFMLSLNIETKISRMKIEILQEVDLLKEGDKVSPSQAELLRKLGMTPFMYGLKTVSIFDNGDCYAAFLLDLSDDDVANKMCQIFGDVTCISLSINYPSLLWFNNIVYGAQKFIIDYTQFALGAGIPTTTTVPHMVTGTYSELMNLCVGAGLFPKFAGKDTIASKYKEYQDNPELAAAAKAAAEAAAAAAAPPKEAEKAEAAEEEESDDMDLGGLF